MSAAADLQYALAKAGLQQSQADELLLRYAREIEPLPLEDQRMRACALEAATRAGTGYSTDQILIRAGGYLAFLRNGRA